MANIFKKGIGTNENKTIFLGAFVPSEINTFVTLHSIATGKSKNKIIVESLNSFFAKDSDITLEDVVILVAKKANEAYQLQASKKGFSKSTFYLRLKGELSKKKIEPAIVQKIIDLVKANETK